MESFAFFSRMERNMKNWSRKILSTGHFPWRKRGSDGRLGPHHVLSFCTATYTTVLAVTKVGDRAEVQYIFAVLPIFFYFTWKNKYL